MYMSVLRIRAITYAVSNSLSMGLADTRHVRHLDISGKLTRSLHPTSSRAPYFRHVDALHSIKLDEPPLNALRSIKLHEPTLNETL